MPTRSSAARTAAKPGKARIQRAIDLTRELLEVPADYLIGIVPASDTGAVEMAMWSMLGARGVDMLAWESFGEGWVTDVQKQLKLADARIIKAGYGELPDLTQVNFDNDVVFTWNGTTSGVRVPGAEWIPADRKGLTICDATSAAFAQRLDFKKLDVVTFSWQKALGGEAAHGVLILSPRAVERLETYKPDRPLPKIFRLTKGGKLLMEVFEAATINTPSMLVIEDAIDAMDWGLREGGLKGAAEAGRCQLRGDERLGQRHAVGRFPRPRAGDAVEHLGLPLDRRSGGHRPLRRRQGGVLQGAGGAARQGRRRLRHRRLQGRASGSSHLVRLDGRNVRPRDADAVARLRVRVRKGRRSRRPPPNSFRGAQPCAATSPFPLQEGAMPKVLVSDKLSKTAVQIFKDNGVEVDYLPDLGKDKDKLLEVIGQYDGLAIRSATKVTEKIIAAATNLKVIGRAGIGVDNVDIPAATKKGIIVMNTPFGNSITTAEHAISLMLSLARQIPEADASTRAGKWEKNRFMGTEVTNKILGLIGAGNIGSIVADRAIGLKMRVLAYDPFLTPERAVALGVEKVELDELLTRADFITLHTPLTEQTKNILSANAISRDQARRPHRQLRARRADRRGGAGRGVASRDRSRARRSTCSSRNPRQRARCSRCPTSSARRISAPRPPRRRRMSRCRLPSRFRPT